MPFNKPIVGTLQPYPLLSSHANVLAEKTPGRSAWLLRGEQEATSLLSCGVNHILIETAHDLPFRSAQQPFELADVALLTALSQRVSDLTQLPLGLNILPNHPEVAWAVSVAVDVAFIRVPALLGNRSGVYGPLTGSLPALLKALSYKAGMPALWIDLFGDLFGQTLPDQQQQAEAIYALFNQLGLQGLLAGFVVRDENTMLTELHRLRTNVDHPVWLEITRPCCQTTDILAQYEAADGLIIGASFKKELALAATTGFSTLDPIRLEEALQPLKNPAALL